MHVNGYLLLIVNQNVVWVQRLSMFNQTGYIMGL